MYLIVPEIQALPCRNGTIHAYLDDTPILEYARSTMDAKCQLRLVGKGFGEDGYGIGLPRGSFLKVTRLEGPLEGQGGTENVVLSKRNG